MTDATVPSPAAPAAAPGPSRRRKRRLKILLIGLGVLAVLFVVSVQVTSSSKFCSSCHYMKPFYQSWQESKHAGVPCKVCHYPPGGLGSKLRAKMEGLVMVGRYWTKLYLKSKPWAEIQDESCLRPGCHDRRLLEGQVKFGKIVFDHKAHFADLKRGKELRCTSCHSQIVQGAHITVTNTTCFICHFKKSESHPAAASCSYCHRRDDLLQAKDRFDHAPVFAQGFSCDKCHTQVIQGEGAVPRENCFKCHFERDRLDKYGQTDLVHATHITANKIECDQCHSPIEHRIVKDIEVIADCKACHSGSHQAQKILYAGQGGKGVPHARPNVMYEKGLSCKGCHVFHESSGGKLVRAETLTSVGAACESCHGRGFSRILKNWQTATSARLAEVKAVYDKAAAVAAAAPSGWKDSVHNLLEDAAFDMEIVERGKSVHNMSYAQELLGAALGKIRDALKEAGAAWTPAVPPALVRETPNACLECHGGIEEITSPVFGLVFPHRAHVVKQKMDCASCHSNARRHGEMTSTKESCSACHHRDVQKDCTACHAVQKTLYQGGAIGGAKIPKDIMAEAGTACPECHLDKAKKVVRPGAEACVACHDEGYRKTFDEWRQGFQKRLADLKAALHELYKRPPAGEDQARVRAVEELIRALEADGSGGIHNFPFAEESLAQALKLVLGLGGRDGGSR